MKNSKLKNFVKTIDKASILKNEEIIKLKGGAATKETTCECFLCGAYNVSVGD